MFTNPRDKSPLKFLVENIKYDSESQLIHHLIVDHGGIVVTSRPEADIILGSVPTLVIKK